MQRCTDCGYSNRSDVYYCTHCGRPLVASGASLGGPTTVVAAVVLAIGLLAFLTIRPVASTQSPAETLPSSLHDIVADDKASPSPAARVEMIVLEDEAADPAREAAADGSTAQFRTMPGLDPSLASADVIQTPSSDLKMPASSSPASSLMLQAAPTLASRERTLDPADGEQPSVRSPTRPPTRASVASSSMAKRAAVESGTRSGVARVHAKVRESWRVRLRTEVEACDGNFIVRTVCVERAKMQHCTSADAWGEVPECPAAQPTELATFN